MYKKINSFFLIFIILFSMFPVRADAPIKYYEIDSDIELRGAIFVNVDPDGFYASLNNGVIQIDSNNHYNDVMIKFKGIALNSRLKKYNGFNIGYTHISNSGIITNELKSLKIDYQGFAYLNTDFSTVIINGMTGITTTTLNELSGNQSISVPDGSSYDLNITNNQPGVWVINGTDYSKRVLWTLNTTSENLIDFQVKKITPFDSDMQVDMDDRIITYYENDTLIPFWDEKIINSTNATGYVKVPKTSTTEQQQYWLYYKNSSMNSASNGNNTFIQYHGTATVNYLDSFDVNPINIIYETKVKQNTASSRIMYGLKNTIDRTDDHEAIMVYPSTPDIKGVYVKNDGSASSVTETYTQDTNYHKYKLINNGTNVYGYDDNNEISTGVTTNLPNENCGLFIEFLISTGVQDWSFVRKYTATEPTWAVDGGEQTASGTVNITASVTGDNNTQSYNASQSKEFTLTPTGITNNVIINTTSTDYNITVTTYWTENTTLQTETVTIGYAKQYINYTSSFNITNADLNTTFTFNFSAQDYIGIATSTLNDVSKTTIRNEQDINSSVGSLIKNNSYWWNVTVPYNNIFTLSNQSDTTAYLGVSKQFTDSIYNDPDNNPIFSRLWNFGDNSNISISNPTHTYISLGTFNTNYSVTENATTNSQTITKEFNVIVEVQPPQNVTTIPHQTNISINWNNYTYADKYSVYELEDGFPYVDTDPIIDGIKDTVYNYAHEFLIFSPNPITHGDYGTIYPVRTVLGAYLLIESIDNDDKSGDDDTIYYFDLDNDGLTADDSAWKITDNIVKKYLWDGVDSWDVTGSTNAVGDSTGGGTYYPIHELFIPVAELGSNWTNGSTVKVLVKREDSSLHPDVITWYPYGNINDSNTDLWQEMILNDPESYNLLANVTLSNYTAINLTPFTIYHGAVSSWNGTTESDYTLFDVITEDIPFYNVSGYILDDLGNKLSGAIIYSCNGFVHEITQSDIYGYWIGYNFREGNYTICGNKSGYIANSTNIYVSSNMTNINVTLTAYTITDWEIYQKLLLLESQNDEMLLNNIIINDKIDTILIFILLNMAVIVGIIIGKRGKDNDK